MQDTQRQFRPDQPAIYQIEVEGKLCERCAGWFDDMDVTVRSDEDGTIVTTLTGTVSDQAALHGLLGSIRDLGLLLLSVQRVEDWGSKA